MWKNMITNFNTIMISSAHRPILINILNTPYYKAYQSALIKELEQNLLMELFDRCLLQFLFKIKNLFPLPRYYIIINFYYD
jgi:hypothetical protein